MRELAVEAERERQRVEADLLHDLGRPATAADRIAMETISATTIRARRLRADGRSDAEERKLIAQLMRATGLKPALGEPAKPPSLDLTEYLALKYGQPKATANGERASEQRNDEMPTGGAANGPSEAAP